MKKLLIVVAVLSMTAVGYGEEANSQEQVSAPVAKTKKVKVKKVTKKKRRKAAAAPVAPEPAPTTSSSTTTTTTTVETAPAPAPIAPSTVETVAVPAEAKVIGLVDLRPTLTHQNGEWHSENEAALGYQFNKNGSVAYHQVFNTNVYNPNEEKGLDLVAKDGFVKVKLNNLAGDTAGVALSYEGRVYTPTDSSKRNAGLITQWRNYFKLRHDFGKTFNLTLMEVPIAHAYERAGTTSPSPSDPLGKAAANPVFENRVYLVAGLNLTDNLSFEFPVVLQSVRNRDYDARAGKNNDWRQMLWIYPELSYQIMPNLALGVAYYNDNFLVNESFDSFKLKEGLQAGYTQAVLRASL